MKRNSNLNIFRIIGDLDIIEGEIIERIVVRKACKSEIALFNTSQMDGVVWNNEIYLIAAKNEISAIKQWVKDMADEYWTHEQVYKECNHDWRFSC